MHHICVHQRFRLQYWSQYFESWSFESFNNWKVYNIRHIDDWYLYNKVTLLALESVSFAFVWILRVAQNTEIYSFVFSSKILNLVNVRSVYFKVTKIENDKHSFSKLQLMISAPTKSNKNNKNTFKLIVVVLITNFWYNRTILANVLVNILLFIFGCVHVSKQYRCKIRFNNYDWQSNAFRFTNVQNQSKINNNQAMCQRIFCIQYLLKWLIFRLITWQ